MDASVKTGTQALPTTARSARIWAVGGGKGGVGKSLLTVNLGVALARSGKRCILLDADLGGANLHTLLGLPHPPVTLTDFLTRKAPRLADVVAPTSTPGLFLISGSRAQLDQANLKHALKEKVIRHLPALEADYLLIDLGAGSSYNVLDFFLLARQQLLVVAPTPTSVENAYHFLKAAYCRKLNRAVQAAGATARVDAAMAEKVALGIRSPRQLLAHLAEVVPAVGAAVRQEMSTFNPGIVVNQIRLEEETGLGTQMAAACRDFFGGEARHLGNIRNDERVHQALRMRRPLLEAFPQSAFAAAVRQLAGGLMEGGMDHDGA